MGLCIEHFLQDAADLLDRAPAGAERSGIDGGDAVHVVGADRERDLWRRQHLPAPLQPGADGDGTGRYVHIKPRLFGSMERQPESFLALFEGNLSVGLLRHISKHGCELIFSRREDGD